MATDRTDQQIKLTDGRTLGYSEHGALDGKPVFYFHGHPGSRCDWPVFDSSDAAAELGARVIAVDRPGHGHYEAALFARRWGFRLQDISAEVHLWHGGEDENVPVSVGRYVADAIPNCHARFIEDEGHLSLPYNYVREYLRVLVV